jgi:hypothetical protein
MVVMSNYLGMDIGRCIPNIGYFYLSDYSQTFKYGSSTFIPVDKSWSMEDPNDISYGALVPKL